MTSLMKKMRMMMLRSQKGVKIYQSSQIVKKKNVQAIETVLDYSMFTNSGEIGKLATKMSSMVEKENLKLKRQKKITDFFKIID